MNHGPEFCASGAGFVVVYHASAARPGEPATIEVKTPFAPAALTVAARDQVAP